MCDPITATALAVSLTAGPSIYSGYQQNQQLQHAKGAAQAAATEAAQAKIDSTKIGPPQTSPAVSDAASQAEAQAKKRRVALAAGMMSTIGTSGSGAPPSLVSPPQAFATGMKTMLGQ
jgi:hypothetical protein